MEMHGLRDLYIHELKDLLHAEKQITKALPKMAKKATHRELRDGLEKHLTQTKEHVNRIERILKGLGEKPTTITCKGMKGLIAEGEELMKESDETVLDAALISAAQRVEHYEIASYGCVRTYARMIGDDDGARLLDLTIKEEGDTDKKLTQLAERMINQDAMHG